MRRDSGEWVDKIFGDKKEYLCFYDESGILEGGLWVLFKQSSGCVLKVLKHPKIGDILLAVDSDMSYEAMEIFNLDPQNIIRIAIAVSKNPKDIVEYLRGYLGNIKYQLSHIREIPEYHRQIYSYILERISHCNLLTKGGISMEKTGLKGMC